jgi:hypothetical protein
MLYACVGPNDVEEALVVDYEDGGVDIVEPSYTPLAQSNSWERRIGTYDGCMFESLTVAACDALKMGQLKDLGMTATEGEEYEIYAHFDAFRGLKE